MSAITFVAPPDGSEVADPEMGWLKNLILKAGAEYWNAGMGQGWMKFHSEKSGAELILTFEESLGFYLEHIDDDSLYWVSLGEGDFDHAVTVYVGGDPLLLPSAFFVSRNAAWRAVETFCRNGGRTNAVRWARRSEQSWDYGIPEML